ncbi:MAG: ABC transporter ATP-binding protein [Candidatus Bipolaricaulia bacterium]
MLRVNNLTKRFGKMAALANCSLEVRPGSITGIIGPNGSGKSTLFNCISGLLRPTAGTIYFVKDDQDHALHRLQPYQIARLGVGRTFQLNRVFKRMSALDNLLAVRFDRGKAQELLELVGLQRLKDHLAGQLSIGQQRLLEIARVFMLDPRMVLLDEPTAGVTPKMIGWLAEHIQSLRQTRQATFVVVEHNLRFILGLSDTLYVLSAGQVIAHGPPESIRSDPKVIDAYLGGSRA